MSSEKQQLNLARKWRSASFEELIGQETAVRILKNSLYVNQFFPVYLFAGQRGCGKTSAARIFAAAANCAHLYDFQQSPQTVKLPCQSCDSCRAMIAGKHPDFTEIDAASHTGVDNVRQIIETASYMPLLGRKKIYLIDEAHMLSRAAFNAFLKILEEPPMSVIFMLATTDDQKILETVKSRCFQLHFRAIDFTKLTNHLQAVCDKENIKAHESALIAIAEQSGGSARDALNLLEQVRFSTSEITEAAVFKVLGRLPDERIDELLAAVRTSQSLDELRTIITSAQLGSYNPEMIWQRILSRLKLQVFTADEDIAKRALLFFEQAIQYDELFTSTVHKSLYLEMFFIRCWMVRDRSLLPSSPIEPKQAPVKVAPKVERPQSEQAKESVQINPLWAKVIERVSVGAEPIVVSLIKQADFRSYDDQAGILSIALDKKLHLFSEHFENSSSRLAQILHELLGKPVTISVEYRESQIQQTRTSTISSVQSKPLQQAKEIVERLPVRSLTKNTVKIDQETLPATHAFLQEFAGTVTEITD